MTDPGKKKGDDRVQHPFTVTGGHFGRLGTVGARLGLAGSIGGMNKRPCRQPKLHHVLSSHS